MPSLPQGPLPHLLLELCAYAVGAQWYRINLRAQGSGALASRPLGADTQCPAALQRWAVIVGAIFGAALGSKLLYIAQYAPSLLHGPPLAWLSGKTIAGGLLGGLIGVELAKRFTGWRQSTGDHFVAPLVAGIGIGRVGCQLAGLEDLTYGGVTALPWGWDHGDGIPRHPVALYEVCALLLLAALLWTRRARLERVSGDRFKAFMVGYLALRVLLDCLKPPHVPVATAQLAPALYGPCTAIQWACLAGLAYYLPTMRRWLSWNPH